MVSLFISTFCFLIPFFYPNLSFLLFLFLTPLMYQSWLQRLTFCKGLLWGLVVFSIHLVWFLGLIFFKGNGLLRIVFILLTVSWFSFFAGAWFWLVSFFKKKFFTSNEIINFLFAWIIVTFGFFIFIIRGSLFICDVVEGYVFFNPFIPLAQYPELIWCLGSIGLIGGLIFLFLFQGLLTLGLLTRQRQMKYFVLALLSLLPFLMGLIFYQPLTVSSCGMYYLQPWWYYDHRQDPVFCGYRMVHDVTKVVCDDSAIQTILMPESTFVGDLYTYRSFIPMLCECAQDIVIVFGGQRRVNGLARTSCFALYNEQEAFVYDKSHLLPLLERAPYLFKVFGFDRLLMSADETISYPDSFQNNDVICLQERLFQVFLCSELYFESKKIRGTSILFLGNDSWLYCSYAKRLSELFFNYISVCYKVPILYCTVGGTTNVTKI